jgi:hypothetical protein
MENAVGEIVGNLLALACIVVLSFGGVGAGVGYVLWEKRKKGARSQGRASLGAPLGLGLVHAEGGQDRLGGERGAYRWSIGWEVRKVAGGPPKFVTFFECYPRSLPQVELRRRAAGVTLSGQVGAEAALGVPALDERFVCAGDVSRLRAQAEALLAVLGMGDDLYMLPDRLVLVCAGDQSEPGFLKARVEAMERLLDGLAAVG